MPRVKSGVVTRKRHKKIMKLASGYRGARGRRFRTANETLLKALSYSYRDRRARKREFRRLWIARINAGVHEVGMTYSQFMHGLKLAGVSLNRKVLAELAVSDKEEFRRIVELSRSALK
ncbi:MAG TPA: 50S ribosomal protein L20 [bacterium]|nr:50S ribosomal protein L20 [bacterium]